MRFIDTHKYSPVANGIDLPLDGDLFFHKPNEIPDNNKEKIKFFKEKDIVIDELWWNEQDVRCRDGIYVKNGVEKGGDAIVDGRDAIWNDGNTPIKHWNPNFKKEITISPKSVYLNDADIEFTNGTVFITGRHYFYLNFWKIMAKVKGQKYKDYIHPRFLDMDYLKFARIRMMMEQSKDNSESKARQKGYSETSAGGILGYNYTFYRSSENVIVAGNDEDMHNLFMKTRDGLEELKNTQFYKETSTNSIERKRIIAKRFRSKILGFTAGNNDQVLSRLSPFFVIFEEIGKWAKGLAPAVKKFVEPSIQAENERTGFMYDIGTGGDMEGGASDLEDIHYRSHEKKYLRFVNRFEREKLSKDHTSGWFTSNAWFKIIDKNGNSKFQESFDATLAEIAMEKDPVKKYLEITQKALYAADSFMMSVAGYFGEHTINLLNARLAQIRLHKELQIERHGILEWKNKNKPFEGVRFIETNKEEAFITITEEPVLDDDGKVYRGLYEIGVDSYDQDESATSTSMGAAVMRKKFLDYNTTSNTETALLLERPETKHGGKELFYEHCAMLSVWGGNVEMIIEHTRKLVIDWLVWNGFENLVGLKPRFAFAGMMNRSQAANKFGVDGSMKPHVMAIRSQELDEEFINNMYLTDIIKANAAYKYSRTYNCDITVASAHGAVAAKERKGQVAYSISKVSKERKFKPTVYKRTAHGITAI